MLGVILAIYAVIIITWWVLFAKADKPGWASIIPIYNMIVLLEIEGTACIFNFLTKCCGKNNLVETFFPPKFCLIVTICAGVAGVIAT